MRREWFSLGVVLVLLMKPCGGANVVLAEADAVRDSNAATGPRLDIYGDPLPPGAVARFGSLRLKHSQPGVHAVCFSPDGKMIASGGEDRTVRLWAAETGKLIHVFKVPIPHVKEHRFPITSVAISPKGDLLASGDKSGGLMLWNLKNFSLRYEDHELGTRDVALAFSPDGSTLAAVEQRFSLFLLPTDTPSRAKRIGFRDFRPFWSAWSPDGKQIALIGRGVFERRDVMVIDAQTGEPLAEPESEPRVSFPEHCGIVSSPIDGTLITADSFSSSTRPDGGSGLTVWKRADGKLEEIRRIAPSKGWGGSCSALSHHPKEPLVAYFRNDLLTLHNWKTLEVVGTAVTDRVSATAFSPDGRHLATAGAMLRVWTVPDLKPVFEYHPDILPVSFSKDSRKAAVGSVLWDLKTHQPLHVAENAYAQMGHNHFATRSAYIAPPNGVRIVGGEKTFAYSFNQEHLRVISVEDGKQLVDFRSPKEIEPSSFGINYVDFSEDMDRVVFRTSNKEQGTLFTTVRISDGAVIHRFSLLNNPKSSGSHLTLSPDGRTLATMLGGEGYNLHIFDTATGTSKQLTNFDQERVFIEEDTVFSSKGGSLALYFPPTKDYLVYSIPDGKQILLVMRPVADLRDPLARAVIRLGKPAFSEDDRLLALAEGEFTSERRPRFRATISVWDLKTRERLWTQDWGTELPHEVIFLDNQLLVVGKRLVLWDALSGRLVIDKTAPSQKGNGGLSYQTGVLSPDGQLLLAGRSDGITELLNTNRGKQVGELTAHDTSVESYHFTPNSGQVIMTFQDRTALLWDLPAITKSAP